MLLQQQGQKHRRRIIQNGKKQNIDPVETWCFQSEHLERPEQEHGKIQPRSTNIILIMEQLTSFQTAFILGVTTLFFLIAFLFKVNQVNILRDRIKLYRDPKEFTSILHCLAYQADTVEQFKIQNKYLITKLTYKIDPEAESLKPQIEEKIRRNNEFIEIISKRLDF